MSLNCIVMMLCERRGWRGSGEMEEDDSLWWPLRGKTNRRINPQLTLCADGISPALWGAESVWDHKKKKKRRNFNNNNNKTFALYHIFSRCYRKSSLLLDMKLCGDCPAVPDIGLWGRSMVISKVHGFRSFVALTIIDGIDKRKKHRQFL